MEYTCMNEMIDYTKSPKLVIHDCCSERVWAVFSKMQGHSAYAKNKFAIEAE